MLLFKNKCYHTLDTNLYPQYPINCFIPTGSRNTFHSVLDFIFKNQNPIMQSAINNIFNSTAQAFQTVINTALANSGINLALISTKQNSQSETSSVQSSKNQNEHSEKESGTEQKSNSESKNQNLKSKIISFFQNGRQKSDTSQKSNQKDSKQKKNK
ncbi:MAG: hypothetical protein GX434_17205 [Peptococcaceae bacterium]|nr:hypothetical protein [Peptococcaceae bacterium]